MVFIFIYLFIYLFIYFKLSKGFLVCPSVLPT